MTQSKRKKKKILVVGGAGYVGGSVTDILATQSDKYEFRVYDNLMYEDLYRKPVNFVYGDILDRTKLKKQLAWADAVIWLAAIVGDGACQLNENLTRQTNQQAISWLARNFSGRIVFTSTCSVYGAQHDLLLTEDSLVKPLSLYAETKHQAEHLLKNKDAVIFRLGTLFGVSDLFSRIRMDLVVNALTARACLGGTLNIFGGDQYRPLLHVKDAAACLVKALDFKKQTGSEIFNISKTNIKIIDLAKQIKRSFLKTKINLTEMSFEDARNYQVNCQKAKKYFKFQPKYSIKNGIEEVADLVLNNRVKDFTNPRYSNQIFLKDILNKK
ncbi:MAG: NAD-dependent dehydratase [Candidatus Vogelbacteria bacterium CG22_combo_CG10-13_8_21_14_all_37_9]|uniref:NAD-dependent dehydratase n=1 Tax=Candidatus Vogelbacteria bacterium CG22_combo_CG10-13_8_21_14_all_37_9 TaxID=1975046 RepID=A0A2H0BLD1_9BACT|nr:MAG: NAD-dependent dehydratase [Candidatus Vogelbacteria bacterium CG22_combo_CG10-13_8_21_14_all_37_9]